MTIKELKRHAIRVSKPAEALERINHTLCLNNIRGNIEYGIDSSDNPIDCQNVEEMSSYLDVLEQALARLAIYDSILSASRITFLNEKEEYEVADKDALEDAVAKLGMLEDINTNESLAFAINDVFGG